MFAIKDEIFLAASQMYEKEVELREKYGFMGEEDFTLDRLLADIDVPPPRPTVPCPRERRCR